MTPDNKVPVTEETFFVAVNNAHYTARERLFKKMGKVKYRAAEWRPFHLPTYETSPLTGHEILTKESGEGMVERKPLPPSDLERYVEAFVQNNYYKGGKNVIEEQV